MLFITWDTAFHMTVLGIIERSVQCWCSACTNLFYGILVTFLVIFFDIVVTDGPTEQQTDG